MNKTSKKLVALVSYWLSLFGSMLIIYRLCETNPAIKSFTQQGYFQKFITDLSSIAIALTFGLTVASLVYNLCNTSKN